MKFLKRFMDTVHDRTDGPDPSVLQMLPPDCFWSVGAKAEIRATRSGDGLDGILGHNGTQLAFVSWTGRHVFSEQLDDVRIKAVNGDRLRLCVNGVEVQVWAFMPLDTVVTDAPESTAEFREHDQFAGLLSYLPVLI